MEATFTSLIFKENHPIFQIFMTEQKSPFTFGRIALLLGIIGIVAAVVFWNPIKAMFFSAVPSDLESQYVYIPTNSSFEQVVNILKKGRFIEDESGFRWLADQMKYKKEPMRPGRFEIKSGWTIREMIQHLRIGEQAPVKVILNNERLPEDVAGKVARTLESDSASLIQTFRDPAFLAEIGCKPENLITLFIPNTYEMYWNTDPKGFVRRMIKEHDAFWDKNNRRAKAKALGLPIEEVYTLASIVERETNANSEKPTIAGVYLNRLRINMPLQADPTCVFATRDFETHRVTQFHTTFQSPYNTYIHTGLPPGPISMAAIPTIDAVLNPEKHNYLYFCAKPDDSGTHAFAATLQGHNVNVDRFRIWMRQKGM
jgi:UPF0755 protein